MASGSDNESKNKQFQFKEVLNELIKERKAEPFILGVTKGKRNIEAYYFPGKSDKRAVIIGGMHGSELSSISLAEEIIAQLLKGEEVYYNVIVIPRLFPDNAAKAMSDLKKAEWNFGRYSHNDAVDPNRQMPSIGKVFLPEKPCDHLNREIEIENQVLLQLINEFKPDRIANLHAIRNTTFAGIFADPRTDARSIALGYETDSSLAVHIASHVRDAGGNANGNFLNDTPRALYYRDPVPAPAGQYQVRNFAGSSLPNKRGCGVSLGTWASTAVQDANNPAYNRPAIRLLTVEFPGYLAPSLHPDPEMQVQLEKQVDSYAKSLVKLFLGEYYVEEHTNRAVK